MRPTTLYCAFPAHIAVAALTDWGEGDGAVTAAAEVADIDVDINEAFVDEVKGEAVRLLVLTPLAEVG